MRFPRAARLLVLGAVWAPWDASAQSQARDPAAADELFDRGKDLLAAGNWAEACAKFHASLTLDPSVGTLLKIARCDEHDQKLALALHDYRAALQLNRVKQDETEERRAEVDAFTRAAIAQLEPRVPTLRIVVENAPVSLVVTRGGEQLPEGALGEALPVDPGTIEVEAAAPGYQTERKSIQVAEAEHAELALKLTPAPASASALAATAPPVESRSAPNARRIAGYVLGGTGVITLGVAAGFGIATIAKVNAAHCPSACPQPGFGLIQEAGQYQTAGFVLLAVGVPLLAAGGILVFLGSSKSQPSGVKVGVGPRSLSLASSF